MRVRNVSASRNVGERRVLERALSAMARPPSAAVATGKLQSRRACIEENWIAFRRRFLIRAGENCPVWTPC